MTWEETNYKKFEGLIIWASKRYAEVFPSSFKDKENLIGEGFEVLAICFKRWKEINRLYRYEYTVKSSRISKNIKLCHNAIRIIPKMDDEKEFEKFFKTSLFNKYKSIARSAFSKKYYAVLADEDKSDNCFGIPYGFENTFYEELIDYISSLIKDVTEKIIFRLLVDPPEKLCEMAVDQNRRKLKLSLFHNCKGVNKVKLSTRLVLKYLNENNVHISEADYRNSVNHIKDIVSKTIKESRYKEAL